MTTVIGYDATNATAQPITINDGYISCEAYDYGYDVNEQTAHGVADGEQFSTVAEFVEWAKTQEWFSETIPATLNDLTVQEHGFYASFTQDVGDLVAGDEIYLQLPQNADSQHDSDYDSDTVQACIDIIKQDYSDADLSLMFLLQTTKLDDVVIKDAKISIEDFEGETKQYRVSILKQDDSYMIVKESGAHKYYTNNSAWVLDDDSDNLADDDDKITAFNESDSIEYSFKA